MFSFSFSSYFETNLNNNTAVALNIQSNEIVIRVNVLLSRWTLLALYNGDKETAIWIVYLKALSAEKGLTIS